MNGKTIGLITAGQIVGRVVPEYITPVLKLDTPSAGLYNPVMGQPMSRLANAVIGTAGLVAAVKVKQLKANGQLISAIAGSRMLVDAVMDGVSDYMAPTVTPTTRLGVRPVARVSGYSGNGGLITVD